MTVSSSDLETSIDGFLDNTFQVIQSKRGAHRSGMDAILLAAAVPEECSGTVADFGAGCGVAGMAVAQRCPRTNVTLIEIDRVSVELAEQSLQLEQNHHLQSRLKVISADLSLTGEAREDAGLQTAQFDRIISNPPYNSGALQASPDQDRARAHVMEPDLLLAWVKTAAFVAKPKATLSMILRPETLEGVLQAFGNRFGSARVLPIHSKPNLEANRIIVQAIKGGKAPLKILPGLVLHQDGGGFTEQAEEILRGRAALPMVAS